MANRRFYTCGVPKEHCNGAHIAMNARMGGPSGMKAHGSPEEAFRCKARYLKKVLGYKQIGGREFAPPDGGPVMVLTKKSRFGGVIRAGKGGDTGKPTRYMPEDPNYPVFGT